MRRGQRVVVALALVAAAAGCGFFERFKSCRDVRVRVVNSQQTLSAVNIAAPGEDFTPETLLESGASREIVLCLDRGESVKFRAAKDGQVLGIARCVADQSSYEGTSVTVLWTLQGFLCQGW